MLPDELIDEAARLFALLSDPNRLRLVRALHQNGELPVGDVAERADTSVANASQHLLRLAAAGLVARRRDGRRVLYRIADPRIEPLCETVCESALSRMPAAAGAGTLAGREGL